MTFLLEVLKSVNTGVRSALAQTKEGVERTDRNRLRHNLGHH